MNIEKQGPLKHTFSLIKVVTVGLEDTGIVTLAHLSNIVLAIALSKPFFNQKFDVFIISS